MIGNAYGVTSKQRLCSAVGLAPIDASVAERLWASEIFHHDRHTGQTCHSMQQIAGTCRRVRERRFRACVGVPIDLDSRHAAQNPHGWQDEESLTALEDHTAMVELVLNRTVER